MISFSPLTDFREVISILSQISLFGGATEPQLEQILPRLQMGVIEKGDAVFEKGQEPSHIYIVKSGEIELLIPGGGIAIRKKSLGTGECFGQVAVMSMQNHAVSAVASERSEIIALSRRAMHQLRHENIELFALLMMNIAREMARRLKFTDEMLLNSHQVEVVFAP